MKNRRTEALLERAATQTMARIYKLVGTSSPDVQTLLRHIKASLFSSDFDVNELQRRSGVSKVALTISFHDEVGESTWSFISRARLETSLRLLRDTALTVGEIGKAVGYSTRKVFSNSFKRWTGLAPEEFRRAWGEIAMPLPSDCDDIHSMLFLEELRSGRLSKNSAKEIIRYLGCEKDGNIASTGLSGSPGTIAARNTCDDFATLDWLCEELRKLSPAEQHNWILCFHLNSPALFQLLGKKIETLGRLDTDFGLRLSELTLECLDLNEAAFGEEFSGLRALGLSWLADSHRRKNNICDARRCFSFAWEAWNEGTRSVAVEAEICFLEATFKKYQRDFESAEVLLTRSITISQVLGRKELLVAALLQRVAIVGYTGAPETAIADVEIAIQYLDGISEPYLEMAAHCDLATLYALSEQHDKALEQVSKARKFCECLGNEIGCYHLCWIAGLAYEGLGDYSGAERLFEEARSGLISFNDIDSVAVISLALASVHFRQGKYAEAARLAYEAIPVFEALDIADEKWATVRLLEGALAANTLEIDHINRAREMLTPLLRDPAYGKSSPDLLLRP